MDRLFDIQADVHSCDCTSNVDGKRQKRMEMDIKKFTCFFKLAVKLIMLCFQLKHQDMPII